MKGFENKNVFAKVVMIIALVIAVAEFIITSIGYYKLYFSIGLAELIQRYTSTFDGLFLTVSVIVVSYFSVILTFIWLLFIARGKEKIKTPVIITFVYVCLKLIRGIYLSFRGNCGLIELVRGNFFTALIFAAWLILLIGTKLDHRLVFAILGGIVAVVDLFGWSKWELSVLGNVSGGNPYLMEHFTFILYMLDIFVLVVFILWILKPELFDKKSESKGI